MELSHPLDILALVNFKYSGVVSLPGIRRDSETILWSGGDKMFGSDVLLTFFFSYILSGVV